MRQLTVQADHEQDTERLAEAIASCCFAGCLITLDGGLGAGKTRLTQAIARALGVRGIVNSPTFTIIKEYEGSRFPLYHMDVYRITEDEAAELGLDEYFEGDGVSIVEWASLIPSLLPPERCEIFIEVTGEHSRLFHLRAVGERYERWLDELREKNLGR
jgi:tRNA threonylcarbamoyladenosine biosynthesis protein TsaE